tara:strand:- start:198 stop:395 length:198 start_codon:yes stop_codon:yes gene_type:complete
MKETYGLGLNEKTLKFLVKCIDIAQKTQSISPDKEEMDLIRRIGRKADELLDKEYDEYQEYEFKG